jgi:release factor glutamine methyltransferase
MTVFQWLTHATMQLGQAGIETARLDALVLLEDITAINRAQLLAEPSLKLTSLQQAALKKLLIKRAVHQPLAYIRGRSEFYGRNFVISRAVLVPRPESEAMIELLLQAIKPNYSSTIADIGAGSGALGITAALELPTATVELLEIDSKARKVAEKNVDLFTLRIPVITSDLLNGSDTSYTILLCNLPYVPDHYVINQAATYEPSIALFGGSDGLDLYRKLFVQISLRRHKPLFIFTEALLEQHDVLKDLASQNRYQMTAQKDLIQQFELLA